jgi:hypothetical protein
MEELTTARREEAVRKLHSVIKEFGCIEPEVLGHYLLRHIEADRAINKVKKVITSKKDFNQTKDTLLDLEYFAFLLTKNP